MKRALFSLLVALILFGLLVGCGGGKKGIKTPGGGDVPEWYLNPEDFLMEKYGSEASYFYGTGQGTKVVHSLAKTAADTRARMEVATQVGLEVKAKIQDYMAQSGATEGNPGVLEFTEVVSKQIAAADMVGCRVIQRASKDNRTYFSLAIYSLNDAQKLAAQIMNQAKYNYMGNEQALFNEFKARQAFEALDGEEMSEKLAPRGGNNPERD